MPVRLPHLPSRIGAAVGVSLFAATGAAVLSTSGTAQVAADRDAAAEVRARIAAETRRIEATADGLASAQQRLAKLQAREAARRTEFLQAQDELVVARARLTRLERRMTTARRTLATTLDAAYRRGTPDLANIVLEADGLEDAVEQVEFEVRVQQQNGNALAAVRSARKDADAQEAQLERKEEKFRALAKSAAEDRDAAAAVSAALLRRQAAQLERRRGSRARLATLQSRIRREENEQIAATRASTGATTAAPKITGTGQENAIVARVVAAANRIATTPYVWGGGHGGNSGGYDCSGSISYALAAGGLLDAPLASGGFMSWGLPGPGSRITVYAHGGHAYMVIDGRRFDTTALRSGGTRWTSEMRSSAGFTARHPPGL